MSEQLVNEIPQKDSFKQEYNYYTNELLRKFIEQYKKYSGREYKPEVEVTIETSSMGTDVDEDFLDGGIKFCVILSNKGYKYKTKHFVDVYHKGHYYGDSDDYQTRLKFTVKIEL